MLELQILLSIVIILMLSVKASQDERRQRRAKARLKFQMPKLERLRFKDPSGCGEQTGYNAYYICNADGCKDCQAVNLEEQCDVAVRRVS